MNDSNFYCKSCQYSYKSSTVYREHLKNVHKMEQTSLRKKAPFDPTISEADTKNPENTSCIICKRKYSSRNSYQYHMKHIHKEITITPIRTRRSTIITNPNIQPDPNDSNFFYRSCQR